MLRVALSVGLLFWVCTTSAQSWEAGVLYGEFGPGASVSTRIAEHWDVRLHGNYHHETRIREETLGSLRLQTNEETSVGSAGLSLDRRLGAGFGATLGVWTIIGRRTVLVRPESATILGETQVVADVGELHAQSNVPQGPVPYLGLHAVSRLLGAWGIRLDIGALRSRGKRLTESASGRLEPTVFWRGARGPRLIPVAHVSITLRLYAPAR